ncbi:NAD(P)/FAD-dependent oxidoreductase [Persicirhabdus sediminis]|uniref:NAD(P)-binding protein n=1 Tax=Persicirhabdus sediminis TaxID=454144 RepID=A0A8J7MCX7_9BACT|nr:NAD(P)-binding protein [Persicirhabdus sediminis]MBK1790261.1 NAD(P)-binding protein [Persicirhabdus sediminis]
MMAQQIHIIGGGLAGLSLANGLAARGIAVQVYEKRRYPQHRVCGEFICGVSEGVLNKLHIQPALADSIIHRQLSWHVGDRQVLSSALPTPAYSISRFQLDHRLADQLIAAGGSISYGKVASRSDAGWVNAQGKNYRPTNTHKNDGWIGLKIHLYHQTDGLEMHLANNGYIGLCSIDSKRSNVCGLFRLNRQLKGKGLELIINYLRDGGLNQLADQLAKCDYDKQSFSAIAGFEFGDQPAESDRFCIGDAASLIEPFTGNGMSMALESAALAVDPLVEYANGNASWLDTCASYRNAHHDKFHKRQRMANSLHPLMLNKHGQWLLSQLCRTRLLPFKSIFHHLRT